ncbi:MAG: hypothetical protein HN590_18125, partial [Calditrichaeota bacterium]|nr:hypothetical protein [Calditrichota bacterium]
MNVQFNVISFYILFISTAEIVSSSDFFTVNHKEVLLKCPTNFVSHANNETQYKPIILASSEFDFPEVITWSIPNGTSQHSHVLDGTIRPMLGTSAGVWCQTTPVNCCELGCNCYQRSPNSVVNKLANKYAQNESLYGESPAIFLQELGMGDGDPCPGPGVVQHWQYADALFLNWCDQIKPNVEDPCNPPSHESARWLSPWNDNGIDLLKNWMLSFLEKYQIKVAAGTLPIPGRFVFDTEYWPMAPFWGDNSSKAFRDLAGLNEGEVPDSRWDTKILSVFNKTLKELYDEAIAEGMTPPIQGNWSIEENQSWCVWYDGIMSTMCDAAMKEAFFDPIKEIWPDVICSNFDTSISADGLQSIPGSPLRVFRNRRHQSASWFVLVQYGSSDEQAAELYSVSEFHLQPNEEPGLAWSRVHRANIEACMESYDGYALDEIMPWIPLINTPFVTGWDGGIEYPDKWSVRNLIAMFRSKGIKKFIVWSTTYSENTQNWREFNDLIDQVWLTKLINYSVNVGSSETDVLHKLIKSDWNWKEEYSGDVLTITSEDSSSDSHVECDLHFKTDFNCSQTREMQLMVDARLEGDLLTSEDE